MSRVHSPASDPPAGKPPRPAPREGQHPFWRYGGALLIPLLLWVLVLGALSEPLQFWLKGQRSYDELALKEWIEEARCSRETLPGLVQEYVEQQEELAALPEEPGRGGDPYLVERLQLLAQLAVRREEIQEHLQAMGLPPTKMHSSQLPLFPTIYRLEVGIRPEGGAGGGETVVWDSGLPVQPTQYLTLEHDVHPRARVTVHYQLHAYNKRQRTEQQQRERLWLLSVLAVVATCVGATWMALGYQRERERERQKLTAQHQASEAERRQEETERKLLQQRLATQAAEQKALELKSQMYASIGIMAGSYAHNIKNLLVRPNDLLERCLEEGSLSSEQSGRLEEVRDTLGTVTERLQQILKAIRRDPTRTELTVLDLRRLVGDLQQTWKELALEKWKLELTLELPSEADRPLWIRGDLSHLQQAIENLLFNARDATFEKRGHLREEAHRGPQGGTATRRQALIAAAAWKGRIALRARQEGAWAVLEVDDNGIGMTEEVQQRCLEAHFTTKRDNALYEGLHTGMGLGLSFVATILEHHHARLEISSRRQEGTTFRVFFPLAGGAGQADGPAPPGETGE